MIEQPAGFEEVLWRSGDLHRKLHPGPSVPRSAAARHQRGRLCRAMIDLVAERGYESVTVIELAHRAEVSKHTLYQHFDGKHECFIATHEEIVRRTIGQVAAAQESAGDWREGMRAAHRAYLREVAGGQAAARLALVEALAVGPVARARVFRAEAAFEALIARSINRAGEGLHVPHYISKGIVAGTARVARARLLAGRAAELPDLVDQLCEWALSLCCEAGVRLGALLAGAPAGWRAPLRDEDAGDDRAHIFEAVARLVDLTGFDSLTPPLIRKEVRLSPARFTRSFAFADMDECVMATLEHLTLRALKDALLAAGEAHDWPGGVCRALTAICMRVAENPGFARLGFVEVLSHGAEGVQRGDALLGALAEAVDASAPALHRPGGLKAEASVGAAWGVLRELIVGGGASRVRRTAPALCFLLLAPAIGGAESIEAIAAEQARMRAELNAHGDAPDGTSVL